MNRVLLRGLKRGSVCFTAMALLMYAVMTFSPMRDHLLGLKPVDYASVYGTFLPWLLMFSAIVGIIEGYAAHLRQPVHAILFPRTSRNNPSPRREERI